jgi:hypothetical protein
VIQAYFEKLTFLMELLNAPFLCRLLWLTNHLVSAVWAKITQPEKPKTTKNGKLLTLPAIVSVDLDLDESRWLVSSCAFVPQTPWLINGTISEK